MCRLTVSDKDKLGNTVVYIASHTENLSKTKLLKLLYFMEEYSVRRFHTPFLGLPYEVWQALIIGEATYIQAAKKFCDDEFSDNDLLVMQEVLKKYGNKSAKELEDVTSTTTNFADELDEAGKQFYQEQIDFLQTCRNYAKE